MKQRLVDLRTDGDSLPPSGMRRAIIEAIESPSGFNSPREDSVTTALEERVADLLGKEAGTFLPTGRMSDLVAIMTYCNRGDEAILGDLCHVVNSECGGGSGLAGAMFRILTTDSRGMLNPAEIERAIHPVVSPDSWKFARAGRTKVVCIENTHNVCGGSVLNLEDMRQIAEVAHRHSVPVWCDGARFVNAKVHLGVSFSELAQNVDSVSFGFTKGLGVYYGSVLVGPSDFIQEARRNRLMLGGELPVMGYLASACLWALDHGIDRVPEDHANARFLAEAIANMDGLSINMDNVQTNIVMFDVVDIPRDEYIARLEKKGILCWPFDGIRMVTDNLISRADIEYAIDAIHSALKE